MRRIGIPSTLQCIACGSQLSLSIDAQPTVFSIDTNNKKPPGSNPTASIGQWRPNAMNNSSKKNQNQTDMFTSYELVTPPMATKWLSTNSVKNRPIDSRVVAQYAKDMAAGDWRTTHQGICFNDNGELVDGQHRLTAIVKSGAPVRIAVTRNAPVEFDAPVDRGRVRSVSTITGLNSRQVAACRLLVHLESGSFTAPVSVPQHIEAFNRNEEDITAILNILTNRVRAGVVAALIFAYPLDRERVQLLAIQIRDGELLTKGDPALSLRSWLSANSNTQQSTGSMYATLNAIRAALSGTSLTNVHTGESGYRAICTQRRARKIPFTPDASTVDTMQLVGTRARRQNAGGA